MLKETLLQNLWRLLSINSRRFKRHFVKTVCVKRLGQISKTYDMNKSFLSAFLFLSVTSFQSYSQTSSKMSSKSKETATLSTEKVEAIQKKINQIDGHLQAIEIKRSYILSSLEQTEIAEASGWFKSITTTESQLNTKKKELLDVLNNSDND